MDVSVEITCMPGIVEVARDTKKNKIYLCVQGTDGLISKLICC